jgi:hypothetical protein
MDSETTTTATNPPRGRHIIDLGLRAARRDLATIEQARAATDVTLRRILDTETTRILHDPTLTSAQAAHALAHLRARIYVQVDAADTAHDRQVARILRGITDLEQALAAPPTVVSQVEVEILAVATAAGVTR